MIVVALLFFVRPAAAAEVTQQPAQVKNILSQISFLLNEILALEQKPHVLAATSEGVFCPANGAVFVSQNKDFMSLVGNELQIALFYGADLDYIADLYVQAGIKNVRIIIDWFGVEKTKGIYDWSSVDERIEVFSRKGINPVAILGTMPQWASSCPDDPSYQNCSVKSLSDWKRFVRAAAKRYGAKGTREVTDWEIRIESLPNKGLLSKEKYVGELNAAYNTIKSVDRKARVWGPEVAFVNSSSEEADNSEQYAWVDYVIQKGKFDVFSIHHLANATPATALAHTERVRERLDEAGRSKVPIAVSAVAIKNPSGTQAAQAQNVRDMYACISAGGGAYAFWFAGTEWAHSVEEIPNDTTYGVLDYDFSLATKVKPKVAYYALKELSDALRGVPEIEDPTIELLTPNGGGTLKPGQFRKITWTGTALETRAVDIALLDYRGAPTQVIAQGVDAVSGFYGWILPTDLPNGQYKVRVGVAGFSAAEDESNTWFTVASVPSDVAR